MLLGPEQIDNSEQQALGPDPVGLLLIFLSFGHQHIVQLVADDGLINSQTGAAGVQSLGQLQQLLAQLLLLVQLLDGGAALGHQLDQRVLHSVLPEVVLVRDGVQFFKQILQYNTTNSITIMHFYGWLHFH